MSFSKRRINTSSVTETVVSLIRPLFWTRLVLQHQLNTAVTFVSVLIINSTNRTKFQEETL